MKEFRDFLEDRLNNTDMLVGDFNFYVEDVKNNENFAFQDLLESLQLLQHMNCSVHQSEAYFGSYCN